MSTFGAALAVAWLFAPPGRMSAIPPEVEAGRMRRPRRYSAGWVAGLCARVTGAALVSMLAAGR